MRGRVYVETENGEIIRIFRNPGSAMNSPAWDEKRVKEYPRKDAVSSIRKQVFDRSKNKCEYCGNFITWKFHLHEKTARGKGGEISLENCVAICAACHILRKDSAHGDRRTRFGEN